MKPPAFHPDALAEFQRQAVFYEERGAGLGVRFAEQVEAAIRLAASMPEPLRSAVGGRRQVKWKQLSTADPPAAVMRKAHDREQSRFVPYFGL